MKSKLQTYLSMEDAEAALVVTSEPDAVVPEVAVTHTEDDVTLSIEVPPVEEITEAALAEAEEVIACTPMDIVAEQQEITEQTNVITDIQTELVGIETIQVILQHGIDTSVYAPQFAAMVHTAVERYTDIFGFEFAAAPALEEFAHDDLTGYYTTSLEFFNKVAEKLIGIGETVKAKLVRAVKVVGSDKGIVKSLNAKADAASKRLSAVKTSANVSVSVKGIGPRLGLNGKYQKDLPGAVTKDQKSVQYLIGTAMPAFLKYGQDMRKAAESLTGEKKDAKDKILTSAATTPHPYFAIPKEIREGAGLFSNKLKYEEPKIPAKDPNKKPNPFEKKDDGKGGPSPRDTLRARGEDYLTQPELDSNKASGAESADYTKAEVAKLITAIKQYASLYEKVATAQSSIETSVEKMIKDQTPVFGDSGEHLTRMAWGAGYGGIYLAQGVSVHIRQVGVALTQVVDRAISALESAEKAEAKDKKKD